MCHGGKLETFSGLSAVGDNLTSLSSQSRNKSFGLNLGRGISLDGLLSNRTTLTEGFSRSSGTVALAEKFQIEMPIMFALNDLLNGGK